MNTKKFLMLSLALMLAPAIFEAAKGGKKPGGMEEGDTAQTVIFDDAEFEIIGDGLGIYIHGTDGQITIPSRYLHSLSKFNTNDRIVFADPTYVGGPPVLESPATVSTFQSGLEAYLDGTSTGKALIFKEMVPVVGYVSRVAMYVTVGKQLRLLFGGETFDGPAGACPDSDPLWVRVEAVDDLTGLCTAWTISTYDLRDVPLLPPARACLSKFKAGQYENIGNLEADFEIYIEALYP